MFLFGEGVNIGLGGNQSAPDIWVPGRTPTGFRPVMDKTLIRETRGSRAGSQSSEIVRKHSEGPLEFNVRSNSLHYVLKSLLGGTSTSLVESGVFAHEYRVATDAVHPYIPLSLCNGAHKSFHYPKGFATQLELRTPVNEVVNATAQFRATNEVSQESPYEVAFPDDDYLFRTYEVTIKIANDVDGLGTADPLNVKEFSNTINNNGRGNQYIGDLHDEDVIGLLFDISGNMMLDFEGETFRDIYTDGSYRALQITLERDTLIGATAKPSYTFTYPKVSFENLTPDRPIDDIVRDGVDFTAHYDEDAGAQVMIDGVNNVEEDIEGS